MERKGKRNFHFKKSNTHTYVGRLKVETLERRHRNEDEARGHTTSVNDLILIFRKSMMENNLGDLSRQLLYRIEVAYIVETITQVTLRSNGVHTRPL